MTAKSVQDAIELAFNATPDNPDLQGILRMGGKKSSALYRVPINSCVIWAGNRNRVEWGEIPELAQFIVDNGFPGTVEGFACDGQLHLTDGARRFTAILWAMENIKLTPDQMAALEYIPFLSVPFDEFSLYARQINSESLAKSPLEKARIAQAMLGLVNPDTGKKFNRLAVAKKCGVSPASITKWLEVLEQSSQETLNKIESGEVTFSAVVADTATKKRDAKVGAKERGEDTTPDPVVAPVDDPVEISSDLVPDPVVPLVDKTEVTNVEITPDPVEIVDGDSGIPKLSPVEKVAILGKIASATLVVLRSSDPEFSQESKTVHLTVPVEAYKDLLSMTIQFIEG